MPKSYTREIKDGLKYTYKESFTVIEPVSHNKKSLFCTVCKFILKNFSDLDSFENFECCHECYLKWAESRKDEWKNAGWRPPRDEIAKEIEIRNKLIKNLSLED